MKYSAARCTNSLTKNRLDDGPSKRWRGCSTITFGSTLAPMLAQRPILEAGVCSSIRSLTTSLHRSLRASGPLEKEVPSEAVKPRKI